MKKVLFIAFVLTSTISFAQASSQARDSVAQTPTFQTKVKMAAHKAANNILADPGQVARIRQYSQLIISEPQGIGWLPALSYGCMTNSAINYNSSDGDIEFTVNSIFSKYAFAYFREPQP